MHTLDDAVTLLSGRSNLLVFTGAGVSTDSGIPDFRGPDGLWNRVDPEDYSIGRFLADEEVRRRSWARRLQSGDRDPRPNAAHHAVTRLWEADLLAGCVTQNIDGLHRTAGLPAEALAEVHGSAETTTCVACSSLTPTKVVLDRVAGGEADPHCDCGGILKPNVVFFGEQLPPSEFDRATSMAQGADAVVAVGTTLSVFPAAGIPLEAMRRGAPLVIVNRGPTDFDDLAEVVVDAGASTALGDLAGSLIPSDSTK